MEDAGVAQAVEQGSCKPLVAGSTPSRQHHDSTEWDKFYQSDEIVSGSFYHFMKMAQWSVTEAEKVLELGAGVGQNIPWLTEIGEYYGIEGSAKAVAYLHAEFPRMASRIALGDFSRIQPFGTDFDLVVDRASVPHNDIAAITRTLALVWASLKPGGLFISSDWFSMNHSEALRGQTLEYWTDGRTATGYEDGQFAGLAKVHFSGEPELGQLFYAFDHCALQERITRRKAPGFVQGVVKRRWIASAFDHLDYDSAVWDIIVRKPR